MIAAGRLNRRVTLLNKQSERNSIGEETVSYCPGATLWAARENLTLRETNRMAGMIEQIECKFVIRWRDNVTTDDALDHDGRLYDIVSVEEHGYREALSLFARAQ